MNEALRAQLTALAANIRTARANGDDDAALLFLNAAKALRIANGL